MKKVMPGGNPWRKGGRMDIKEARAKLGMSQQKLSNAIGIPKRTIENWEMGTRKPPQWAENLIKERMDDMTMDMIIKTRRNEDYGCEEYNCGKGWRTTLLGAMEEAGYPIKTQTLTRYLQSVAIHKGLDEYKADQIANQIERFFGELEVPADLNPSREQSTAHETCTQPEVFAPMGSKRKDDKQD
jgi:DNA-binding XRE family transcriptional regulator